MLPEVPAPFPIVKVPAESAVLVKILRSPPAPLFALLILITPLPEPIVNVDVFVTEKVAVAELVCPAVDTVMEPPVIFAVALEA